MDTVIGESRDGAGAGDCDREYVWGRPRENLSLHTLAHLLIIRGMVLDTRAGEHGSRADGDISCPEYA
jgi:hypothetical protein